MMSWGTSYKYEGYISRVGKNEMQCSLDTEKEALDELWQKLLAYAAATPPAYAENEEGTKYPYADFLVDKFRNIRNEMEESYWGMVHKSDCLEALSRNPEEVTEG